MDELSIIENTFGIRLPRQYQEWFRSGYADINSPLYLWVHEAEWIHPRDIPSYELSYDETIKGLVPFAVNGAGDLWCWNTALPTEHDQYAILFCPQDEPNAKMYAPTLPGWFYRRTLEYAAGGFDEGPEAIAAARTNLRTWSGHLRRLGFDAWSTEVDSLMKRDPQRARPRNMQADLFGFLSWDDIELRINAAFGEGYVNKKMRWHNVS